MTLLLALASGCATAPETKAPPELIHDYCLKDQVLWFDHYSTILYLEQNEAEFLRAFTIHNEKFEKFC